MAVLEIDTKEVGAQLSAVGSKLMGKLQPKVQATVNPLLIEADDQAYRTAISLSPAAVARMGFHRQATDFGDSDLQCIACRHHMQDSLHRAYTLFMAL